jgi:hypothetical protein
MKGKQHSLNAKAIMSASHGGSPVFIYDANTFELLTIQPGFRAAGRYLSIDNKTVKRYIKSGKVYNGYFIRSSYID